MFVYGKRYVKGEPTWCGYTLICSANPHHVQLRAAWDDSPVRHVRRSRFALLSGALVLAALPALLFGCGGGGSDSTTTLSLPPGHAAVIVIGNWVDALRAGHVNQAADYFAVPSVVENGTPPQRIETRADAVAFNRSLPCGAKLVRARPEGRYIAATFRLTERPGGACGSGVGQLARTAFIVRDGKIVQWRRLPNPAPSPSGPVV